MGCSASVTPMMTTQSITKVDVATNTIDIESRLSSVPPIQLGKPLVDVFTQTDDLQVDIKTNQMASSKENNGTNSNLNSDQSQTAADDQNQSVGWTDNQINPRFTQDLDDREELEWILNDMDANQFCLTNQALLSSASQVSASMVVDAMEKTNDLKNIPKAVWDLINKARTADDATYLIRAYTAESNFYKILNRRLARQSLGNPTDITMEDQVQSMMANVFTQFGQLVSSVQAFQAGQQWPVQPNNETDWAKLYLKALYRLIMTPNSILRYQGLTYRGMRLTIEELEYYSEDKLYVCNKAITSTSKLRSIAQGFIDNGPRPEDMIDVMFIYAIESFSALFAIDVHTLSLMKHEEEVLLMPGILFKVKKFNIISPHSVEIELYSAYQDLVNGSFANTLTGLFSAFQPELD